jgi:hypothetical protein
MRAVTSVLEQSYPSVELLLVTDKSDSLVAEFLGDLNATRVRIISAPGNLSNNEPECRNLGVREANGDWVAFLNDTDHWLSDKLSRQMALVDTQESGNLIVAAGYMESTKKNAPSYPRRVPLPSESADTYLCCPRGFQAAGEHIHLSTILARRSLLIAIPFLPSLTFNQELVWIVRAVGLGGASLQVLPEVHVISASDGSLQQHNALKAKAWRTFFAAIHENRLLFLPKAYAYCIATRVLAEAVKCREPLSIKLRLLREVLKYGAATPKCILLFFYYCLLLQQEQSIRKEDIRKMPIRSSKQSSELGAA